MYRYIDSKPFINRTILADINRLKKSDATALNSAEDIKKFINNLFESKFLLAMLSRGSDDSSESFSPYLIQSDMGYILPIFTNKFDILKESDMFDDYTIYVDNFSNIILIYKTLLNTLGQLYISIDPFGTNYILDKGMIDNAITIAANNLNELN